MSDKNQNAMGWFAAIVASIPGIAALFKREPFKEGWACNPKKKRRPERIECSVCGAMSSTTKWLELWPDICLKSELNAENVRVPK